MDTIDDRVRQILSDELGVRPDLLASDATLDELGADSMDRFSLTSALEDEFTIEIPDYDGKELRTVRDLVTYITARAGAAQGYGHGA